MYEIPVNFFFKPYNIMIAVQVIKVDENLTPQELAKQLKKPEGDTGKIVGDGMNKSNLHINTNAFDLLDLNFRI